MALVRGARQEQEQRRRARPVRQRPAVRRLQPARGGDQGGLPHRADRPLRRAARPGRGTHPARASGCRPCAAAAAPRSRTASSRPSAGASTHEGQPLTAGRMGRFPVSRPAADRRAEAGGRAEPPVRAAARARRRQALLGVHRGGRQADPGRRRLAGRPPGEGAHHPPLPVAPAETHPVRAGPAGRSRRHRARRARQRRHRGTTKTSTSRSRSSAARPSWPSSAKAARAGSATSAAARARSPGTCSPTQHRARHRGRRVRPGAAAGRPPPEARPDARYQARSG